MQNNATKSPFTNLILDEEERELEAAVERGELQESSDFQASKKQLEEAVRQYHQLHTSKPITLRINQLDLIKIKAKAKRSKIPYQTLLGAILHDFAEGKRELSIK